MPRESWEGPLPPETNEAYHLRRDYLSSSNVKERIPSAYNFLKMVVSPPEEKEGSAAFDLGSSVHEVLLCGDYSQFAVMPDFRPDPKNKITIKAQKEAFELENVGKRIITDEQKRRLSAMVSYIKTKPVVLGYLKDELSLFEQGYLYKDPVTGLHCKFRPDIIMPENGVIIDYKTCADVSPYGFKKAIERYYYHVSEAHYRIGAERVYERPFTTYYYLAQQSTYPYSVGLHQLSMASYKKSIDMRRDLLRLIERNRHENYYPDFIDQGLKTLELSGYAFEIGEERV